MMRYTMPVDPGNPLSFDFAAIVAMLDIPACVWLVPDVDVVFKQDSGIDFSVWQHRIRTATAPGAALAEREFRAFAVAAHQVIDGEFIGFASLQDLLAFRDPLIRIDSFDTTEWIVVVDPGRVGVTAAFRSHFGDGAPVTVLRSRAREFPGTDRLSSARRELVLAGETLDLIEVDPDGATTMRFSNGAVVRFERDFAVATHDGSETFVLHADRSTLVPALRLLADEVDHALVSAARLDVTFRSGAVLSGWADRSSASWRFRDPGRPAVDIDVLAGGTVDVRERSVPVGEPLAREDTSGPAGAVPSAAGRDGAVAVPGTGVVLRLAGAVVDGLTIGFATTLSCSNGSSLVFENPLTVRAGDTESVVDPGSLATLGPLLALHGQPIVHAAVDGDQLVLAFPRNVELRAPTDPAYESWHYAGPERPPSRLMGMPGGGLAWW